MKRPIIQYFKIKKEREEWLGKRYFKLNWNEDKLVQVCMNNGSDVRRGKGNTIGIYLIHRLTFFSNYMSMNYVDQCTKKEYDKAVETIYDFLK